MLAGVNTWVIVSFSGHSIIFICLASKGARDLIRLILLRIKALYSIFSKSLHRLLRHVLTCIIVGAESHGTSTFAAAFIPIHNGVLRYIVEISIGTSISVYNTISVPALSLVVITELKLVTLVVDVACFIHEVFALLVLGSLLGSLLFFVKNEGTLSIFAVFGAANLTHLILNNYNL